MTLAFVSYLMHISYPKFMEIYFIFSQISSVIDYHVWYKTEVHFLCILPNMDTN